MKVRDCLRKPPVTAPPDSSLAEAAQLMERNDVGALLIVTDERLVGIVTDRDLALRGLAAGLDPGTSVDEVMSAPVTWIQGSVDLTGALEMFRSGRFRRLPVLDDDDIAGIVTVDDLLVSLVVELAAVVSPIAAEVASRP